MLVFEEFDIGNSNGRYEIIGFFLGDQIYGVKYIMTTIIVNYLKLIYVNELCTD